MKHIRELSDLRIGINEFIHTRGISGSSVGAKLFTEVLEKNAVTIVRIRPRINSKSRVFRLLYMIYWDLYGASRIAERHQCDAIINPTNTGRASRKLPNILVMHDTMVLDIPQYFDIGYRWYAKLLFGISARSANLIITPSIFSARSISRRWPTTVPKVANWPNRLQQSEAKTEHNSRSILWVASLDQHKRFELCVQVVEFLRKTSEIDLKLIVISREGNDRTAKEKYTGENSKLFDWIEWKYEISDLQLIELYQTSKLLLVTSVAEGFCLPALEAMSQGLPVVHPNIGALVELCGEMAGDANNSEFQTLANNALHLIEDENYWQNQSLSSTKRSQQYEFQFFEAIILRELQSLLCE